MVGRLLHVEVYQTGFEGLPQERPVLGRGPFDAGFGSGDLKGERAGVIGGKEVKEVAD